MQKDSMNGLMAYRPTEEQFNMRPSLDQQAIAKGRDGMTVPGPSKGGMGTPQSFIGSGMDQASDMPSQSAARAWGAGSRPMPVMQGVDPRAKLADLLHRIMPGQRRGM